MSNPTRGEVWWVDFSSSKGGEIQKRRPVVIVSNDSANRWANRVQVVPISSNAEKVYPSEALVHVNGTEGKAMADQIATIDKSRLNGFYTVLDEKEFLAVLRAIKIQLGLVE